MIEVSKLDILTICATWFFSGCTVMKIIIDFGVFKKKKPKWQIYKEKLKS